MFDVPFPSRSGSNFCRGFGEETPGLEHPGGTAAAGGGSSPGSAWKDPSAPVLSCPRFLEGDPTAQPPCNMALCCRNLNIEPKPSGGFASRSEVFLAAGKLGLQRWEQLELHRAGIRPCLHQGWAFGVTPAIPLGPGGRFGVLRQNPKRRG